MTPNAYLEARMRLFPDQARDAVRERIQVTNGWFVDDKGAAFAAFSASGPGINQAMRELDPERLSELLLVDHGFSSASTRPDAPFGEAYVIDIEISRGADIDAISARGSTLWGTGEAEILTAPGQRLEILSVVEREGTTWIRAGER